MAKTFQNEKGKKVYERTSSYRDEKGNLYGGIRRWILEYAAHASPMESHYFVKPEGCFVRVEGRISIEWCELSNCGDSLGRKVTSVTFVERSFVGDQIFCYMKGHVHTQERNRTDVTCVERHSTNKEAL